MADHHKTAVVVILLGFELAVLGYLNMDGTDHTGTEVACTLGICLYIVNIISVVVMRKENLLMTIIAIILSFIAGICLFVGACIWCDETDCDEYTMAITSTAGLLCILGGVFLILQAATGGNAKVKPTTQD